MSQLSLPKRSAAGKPAVVVVHRPAFLTVRGLAQLLALSEYTVYSWAESGKIPCYRIRRALRFDPAEIDLWLQTWRVGDGTDS